MRTPTRHLAILSAAVALCFAGPSWAQDPAQAPARSFSDMVKGLALVPTGPHDSALLTQVDRAVELIQQFELPQAQLAVNAALQLDPRDPQLHFLNGFVYHLQARQGDSQKNELAIEGYQQALRIDPSHWISQEFLGLAHMDLKQFGAAKQAFAGALQLSPQSSVSLYGLMVASYLTGDAETACAMADQFQKTADAAPRGFVRSGIAVYAACGRFEQAELMQARLASIGGAPAELARTGQRLAQWKAVYSQAPGGPGALQQTSLRSASPDASGTVLAQAFSLPNLPYKPPARAAASPSNATDASSAAPADSPLPANASTAPDPSVQAPIDASAAAAPSPAPAAEVASGPRMLLVDVVLLSTQELVSTSKGVNLLNALTLQLGSVSGNIAAYSRVTSSDQSGSVSTAITRAVTVPALSYSLNIANANNSVNEVLARPTLAAIEGLPSEFFSGTNLSAGVVSTSSQGGTTIVPLDKRFGIKLAVTPAFLDQGRVQLKIEAQRTSLNATAENPRAAYQIEIAETTANANVVMNLGDTLVLSGLSERSSSSTRDGVPGLQDVPGLQYLFSNKKTNDIQRSVLILVTPRSAVQLAEADPNAANSLQEQMSALRQRFGFTQPQPANVQAILQHLQTNPYYREFRQGDVAMERWDRVATTTERLKEALGFLYY